MDTGRAAIQAAEMAKEELASRAATMWEVSPDDVVFDEGVFINTKSDERIGFKDLAAQQMALGGTITVSATTTGRKVAPAFAGHIADVEVDPETGKVQLLRYTAFPGRGTGGASELRRRADAGRRGAGHRLGAERGVLLSRRTAGSPTPASSTTGCPRRSTCRESTR